MNLRVLAGAGYGIRLAPGTRLVVVRRRRRDFSVVRLKPVTIRSASVPAPPVGASGILAARLSAVARQPGAAGQTAVAGRASDVQAAGLMERNSRVRASLSAWAASLSVIANAVASSCAKVIPGFRQASASGNDFSFS